MYIYMYRSGTCVHRQGNASQQFAADLIKSHHIQGHLITPCHISSYVMKSYEISAILRESN